MIKSVKLIEGLESPNEIIQVETVHDDGETHYESKMTVQRGMGEGSCANPDGTDNKIAIYGDFSYIETENGSGEMVLSEHSKEDIADAVAVFRVMFGEKMEL